MKPNPPGRWSQFPELPCTVLARESGLGAVNLHVSEGSLICELNEMAAAYRGVSEVRHASTAVSVVKARMIRLLSPSDLAVIIDDGFRVVIPLFWPGQRDDLVGLLEAAGFTVDYGTSWFSYRLTPDQQKRRAIEQKSAT